MSTLPFVTLLPSRPVKQPQPVSKPQSNLLNLPHNPPQCQQSLSASLPTTAEASLVSLLRSEALCFTQREIPSHPIMQCNDWKERCSGAKYFFLALIWHQNNFWCSLSFNGANSHSGELADLADLAPALPDGKHFPDAPSPEPVRRKSKRLSKSNTSDDDEYEGMPAKKKRKTSASSSNDYLPEILKDDVAEDIMGHDFIDLTQDAPISTSGRNTPLFLRDPSPPPKTPAIEVKPQPVEDEFTIDPSLGDPYAPQTFKF
ncbi:hypothetical protein C8R43DRAFT_1102918 [Mycena crocata]|nr:hypothetical protein C8R43DRAFT_1102918 [Mycena crocata]